MTTSLQGKSAFPETHPLSLGSGGRRDAEAGPPLPRPRRRDLRDRLQLRGNGFGVAMPKGKTIIHATLDPADLNKNVRAEIGWSATPA